MSWLPVTGAIVAAALLVSACAEVGPASEAGPNEITIVRDVPYAAGRHLDVYQPGGPGPWPVIVSIHGCCGGRESLFQFAHELASEGILVFNVGWQTLTEGGTYPDVYHQIACAVGYAQSESARYGGDDGGVALLGWVDGALPAATVATSETAADRSCRATPSASTRPNVFIGLSGFYGWEAGLPAAADPGVDARTVAFFGGTPDTAPAAWRAGNPFTHVGGEPGLPVLLVVGTDHPLAGNAECYFADLVAAGYPARLVTVDGEGRQGLIEPRSRPGRTAISEVVSFVRSGGQGPAGTDGARCASGDDA